MLCEILFCSFSMWPAKVYNALGLSHTWFPIRVLHSLLLRCPKTLSIFQRSFVVGLVDSGPACIIRVNPLGPGPVPSVPDVLIIEFDRKF